MTDNPARAAHAASPPRASTFVVVLAFSGIAVSLMQTLVIPLVPELPKLLNASAADAAWAITATLLASAAATPVMGRLGDMYGKRRMLLVSLFLLIAGSVLCGLSDSLTPMIVGRALQGLASGVIPLGISIMRDELPAERLGSAIASMSASLGVGGALGLPAAALIAENFDWHVLFWTAAALGAVAFVLVLTLVPESAVRSGGRFDFVGAIGLSGALVCLLLAISKGADWGWGDALTISLFAVAVVVLLLWGWWELRTREPMVDLRTTARRQVLFTNLASIMLGFAMFAMSLVLPQLLQLPEATGYGLGQSVLAAGLVMAPSGVVMLLLAPVAARLSAAYGPKVTLMLGAIIVAAGYGLNIVLMSEVWQLVLVSCVIGAGIGFAYASMPALVMGAVPVSETAAANSLNTLMRAIGTSVSSAVAGVILAEMTTRFGPAELPSEDGFRVVLAIGAGAALLSFLLAAFLPRRNASAVPAVSHHAPAPVTQTAPVVPAFTEDEPQLAYAIPDAARQEGAVEIRGFVSGDDGQPVGHATLTLIDLRGHQLGRAMSLADGGYSIWTPGTGTYVLIASAAHRDPQVATLVVGEQPLDFNLILAGSSKLIGAVRDLEGKPVPGAVLVLTDVRGEVLSTSTTDPDGAYSFSGMTAGHYTLAVSADTYRPTAVFVETHGTGQTRQDVELRPGTRIRGTVRVRDGVPLADARVTLLDAAGNVVGTTTTADDGAYAFADLTGGQYTLIATGYPPVADTVTINGRDDDDRDLWLAHKD
ncbi:MFS transporter [Nonomuraea monospora]|uniref:MFS transporter n=2 Tax=Nonomuraea monospora TaxID=568818 RepID=A0ABN3D2N6_9ACTN